MSGWYDEFSIGDEIVFINDADWNSSPDYCRVGDRAKVVNIKTTGNIELLELQMDVHNSPAAKMPRSWSHGDILPLAAKVAASYIKKWTKQSDQCPPSLKKWLQSVQQYVRT